MKHLAIHGKKVDLHASLKSQPVPMLLHDRVVHFVPLTTSSYTIICTREVSVLTLCPFKDVKSFKKDTTSYMNGNPAFSKFSLFQ